MKQFIDKLISRLEERKGKYFDGLTCEGTMIKVNDAISIVNQLAEEYKGGWIPCSDRLPEYTGEYNVTVVVANELGSYKDVKTLRFEKIKGREPKWVTPKDEFYRIIAWMPLPSPYQKEGE